MRYAADHKERSRAGLLAAAGRAFRAQGYGVGVDQLARDGGLTAGAFYGHFRSKQEVFREVVRAAMARLHTGLLRFRDATPPDAGSNGFEALLEWYFSRNHYENLPGGCGLPGLSADVARADPETRAVYESGLREAMRVLAESPPLAGEPDAESRAAAILALLAGGVTLARAVRSPEASQVVADAVRGAARAIGYGRSTLERPSGYDAVPKGADR